VIELAYAGLLVCNLVSQNIDQSSPTKDRACVYKCQKKEKPEVVYTDPQFWCPPQLFVEPDEK